MTMTWFLGVVLCVYVAAMFVIGWLCQGKIQNKEDSNIAGRRLPLSLAWATLLATWFGAGTLLTQADSVRLVFSGPLDPVCLSVCLAPIAVISTAAEPVQQEPRLAISRNHHGPIGSPRAVSQTTNFNAFAAFGTHRAFGCDPILKVGLPAFGHARMKPVS